MRAASLARLAAFALLGCAVVDLPLFAQPGQRSAWWTLGGALVGMAFARLAPRGAAWACMAAVGIGMAWDFQRIPPSAILDLCRTGASVATVLADHLRWFPATLAAMVVVIVAPRWRSRPDDPLDALYRLALAALEVVGMALAMTLAMPGVKAAATALGLPWVGAAMTFAMLAGMFVFAAAQARLRDAIRRAASIRRPAIPP